MFISLITHRVLFLHPLGPHTGLILLGKRGGRDSASLPGHQPVLEATSHTGRFMSLVLALTGSSICLFAMHALSPSSALFREQPGHVGLSMCLALAALPIMAFQTVD